MTRKRAFQIAEAVSTLAYATMRMYEPPDDRDNKTHKVISDFFLKAHTRLVDELIKVAATQRRRIKPVVRK